ncbi:F-box protein SKIP14 [Phoenix dactylifera]|uniref:F-box protein SKIP14 n=1 Tax=Phoenix dactylifera TaxID=42345 RepID=A0A8B8IYN1_PHODC|nr:F-box protein SKIP14 [Phoenix dactylifera]
MTLNFSSYSVFPASIRADEDFGSARCDRSAEGFDKPPLSSRGIENPYGNGGDGGRADRNGSCDPVDLLPSDPFGMELSTTLSNTFTAIAGWIEDFSLNSGDRKLGSGAFFEGLSYHWVSQLNYGGAYDGWVGQRSSGSLGYEAKNGVFKHAVDVEEFSDSGDAEIAHSSGGDEGAPHEGLLFALGYLGVQDLLSVERVCRSLHSAVQNDPLLWRCIEIDSFLSEKITDDDLLQLSERAQGNLQCLILVGCSRITDDGLKHVLENNPRLRKLSVPGCVRLSVEGLINALKVVKSSGMLGIKHLELGRLFSVSQEQFEELKFLLGTDQLQQPKSRKPRFYHLGRSSLACDDERAIDIEMCPGCQKFKLVYDCPSERCHGEVSKCRACDVCIARCIQCGKCIKDCKYFETFCLEYLCSGCWKQPAMIQESMEK